MDAIMHFRLSAARMADGDIREVEGRIGGWPFPRLVRFCVGVNCDAIECGESGVVVYRRGEPLARCDARIGPGTPRIPASGGERWIGTVALPDRHFAGIGPGAGVNPGGLRGVNRLRTR